VNTGGEGAPSPHAGREPIGLIAAAGRGTRLAPFQYPKELLPIIYAAGPGGSQFRPRPVLEASLEALRGAGVRQCVIVLADWKLEIARLFGGGDDFGVALGYVIRNVPLGLADALSGAHPWVADRDVCMVLPDTVITPADAMAELCRVRRETGADVVLAVFPTDTPEQLGPVRFDGAGRVLEVLDKPAATDLNNTWGMATWSPRFSEFLRDAVAAAPADEKPTLGAVFDSAARRGLAVRCRWFGDGSFLDMGTPENLASLIWRRNGESGPEPEVILPVPGVNC
jgi:glucose-1-phosphate thymidylyltransferase